jgi:biopolymer transport protein ExbB/TolQ
MRDRFHAKPELRRTIAESTPSALLRQPSFWLAQKDFWIVVLGSIAAIVLLAPYTYIFAHGWVVLTVAVQLLALYGAIIAARAMAKIEVETAIVAEVESRGAAYLISLKSGQSGRIDLQQLEEDILPNNQSSPPPSMIRLFQHICKEARDRRFESSINVIEPYREEALEEIFRLQNIQKIALWLGILGTFIGLLRAIAVGNLGSINESNFTSMIAGMFENLFISFSASLAGLEVAVILGAFLLLLRRRHQTYFQSMETAVVTMLSLARNAVNKDDFFVEFGQIRQSMNLLRDQLYNQTKDLSMSMAALHGAVRIQTDEIQGGMTKLSQTGGEFDGFLKQVTLRHQQLIDDVKVVYDALSLRGLGTTLQETLGQNTKEIAQVLGPNLTRMNDEITKFTQSLGELNRLVLQESREAGIRISALEDQLKNQSREHGVVIDVWENKLRQLMVKVESNGSSALARDVKDLSSCIAALSDSLTRNNGLRTSRRWTFRSFFSGFRRYRRT